MPTDSSNKKNNKENKSGPYKVQNAKNNKKRKVSNTKNKATSKKEKNKKKSKKNKEGKFSSRHPKLMMFIRIMILIILLLCVIGAGVVAGVFFGKKKSKKNKEGKFSSRHPKLMMFIRIMILIILLLCVIGAGVVAGVFFGFFGDDFEITKDELKIGMANTVIVDKNGGIVAQLSGDEKRKVITLEDMSEYLPKAYVAMEDERFYKHKGVDIKRTAGAIVKTLLGDSSYGGSTITQQLVKNITKDDERSGIAGIMRKVREWAKAYQVERMISKQQILELYLNILYVGGEGNLHGVELGAEYYFNKSAKDLSLAQCAYMAGINSSPSRYNPFDTAKDNTELIKKQTKVALNKMNELGYINSQEEYQAAIAEVDAGLAFSKGSIATSSAYSYHTEAVIDQVVKQVMEEKGISQQLAENYVYSSGLTIYSTVDTNIQTQMEQEFTNKKYIVNGIAKDKAGNKLNEHSQSAMVVIDYKTGNVVGTVGGLGEKKETRGLNRATQSVRQTGSSIKPIAVVAPGIDYKTGNVVGTVGGLGEKKETRGLNRATQSVRQTGSSIKPIAVVAPGLQEKTITAATAYMDEETNFGGKYTPKNQNGKFSNEPVNIRYFIARPGLQEKTITAATAYMDEETNFGGKYTPKNQNGKFSNEPVNIRYFIARSLNIPSVKIMRQLTPEKSIEYKINRIFKQNGNTFNKSRRR